MKNKLFLIIIMIVLLITPVIANSESNNSDFNWEKYTYEELLAIQEELNSVVLEKRVEWAIKNGNRVIDFDTEEFTLYTTQTQIITPTVTRVLDDAPETTRLIWTSSDDSIARVSASGAITGIGLGDAEITCKASDDEFIFKTAKVHVILPVTSVSITEPKITLLLSDNAKEAEKTLTASISPENAYCQDVTWFSSNEAIATIDESGKVVAHAPGTTTITVFSSDPFSASYPKRGTATVSVLQAISKIELDQSELTMNKNSYTALKATVFPENASQKTLTWESSDPSVVRVANGQLTAVSTGEATIHCSATDGSGISANSHVKVIQMVNNIRFDPPTVVTLNMNDSKKLDVIVAPDDATDKRLAWSSSDEKVIMVDKNGIITAVGGGNASITCSSIDGGSKTTSINVFVPSISVENEKIVVTDKKGLDVKIPFYGDPKDFSYTPDKTAFFSISDTWDKLEKTFILHISPGKAGSSQIYLKDANDYKSTKTITVTIEHSAAYDLTSFPRPNYKDIMRYPDKYKNTNISIYGRVLQKLEDENEVDLRVATAGWDYVYYVVYDKNNINTSVIEDDYITVYGVSSGNYTYKSVQNVPITIPLMYAEKIYLGAQ